MQKTTLFGSLCVLSVSSKIAVSCQYMDMDMDMDMVTSKFEVKKGKGGILFAESASTR